ncbi:dihydrofolate reductase family protein [Leifsonia sp. L25]|uniref:dihydrofolate reductase family protein n=1 Tax=Actinomycetes TaxID=1760 RepID=UPI003D6919AC
MGSIAVHEFVSLDGVFEDPSWTAEYGFDPEMGDDLARITGASERILLGRRTFEMFAPAWSARSSADDPGAPFFNDTEKLVVSSTLDDAAAEAVWANSRSLGRYDADRVREVKQSVGGSLYISGSGSLVRALIADGLVDALHLFVYPVIRGTGARLFPEGMPETKLRLRQYDGYANGVLHLLYAPA